jgi:low temperature requirement protein LtrA
VVAWVAGRVFAYAQVPESAAKPAQGGGFADDSLHLPVVAVIVFLLAVWGSSFSHSCTSDGCIGIVIPVGGALLALAAQIFVLIPAYAIKRSQASKPIAARVGLWIAVSVAAFVLPMAFAKI